MSDFESFREKGYDVDAYNNSVPYDIIDETTKVMKDWENANSIVKYPQINDLNNYKLFIPEYESESKYRSFRDKLVSLDFVNEIRETMNESVNTRKEALKYIPDKDLVCLYIDRCIKSRKDVYQIFNMTKFTFDQMQRCVGEDIASNLIRMKVVRDIAAIKDKEEKLKYMRNVNIRVFSSSRYSYANLLREQTVRRIIRFHDKGSSEAYKYKSYVVMENGKHKLIKENADDGFRSIEVLLIAKREKNRAINSYLTEYDFEQIDNVLKKLNIE